MDKLVCPCHKLRIRAMTKKEFINLISNGQDDIVREFNEKW